MLVTRGGHLGEPLTQMGGVPREGAENGELLDKDGVSGVKVQAIHCIAM